MAIRWKDGRVSARRPEPAVMEGRFIRLEPMTEEHYPGLWDALGHPAVFDGGYGGGPEGLPADEGAFATWVAAYYAGDNRNDHVVRVVGGPHDGVVVGASTLGDFDLRKRGTHIGWTAYDPRVWGTQVNAEAKLLLLGLAFDHGFERVKLQADSLNDRSRAAIAKLGGVFEGVLRKERLRADGTLSGTAVFSILDDEWPDVRAGLEARLASYGDRPVLFRTADGLRT
jgi:RimJ/RimL family protein N-acetyltransferase